MSMKAIGELYPVHGAPGPTEFSKCNAVTCFKQMLSGLDV